MTLPPFSEHITPIALGSYPHLHSGHTTNNLINMEPLRLKIRQPIEEEIENWDDDDFLVNDGEFNLRSASSATAPFSRRDSTSSRLSLRSDLESWNGEIEENVQVPGDDEKSTLAAITAAENAGIPLPKNVPSSALMGGTIKRLSGRKIRKIIHDDWDADLEFPDSTSTLKIKQPAASEYPEMLRQVSASSAHISELDFGQPLADPFEIDDTSFAKLDSARSSISAFSAAGNLDRFKDAEEDDDFLGDGCETIKVSKTRKPPQPLSFITPPTPQKVTKTNEIDDDFEQDLDLPSNGKLTLSTKREIPQTPATISEDIDWGEGSLGTRHGGTRRDARSNRSSSVSALSPSLSSSFTMESEDEAMDGLILPQGPLDFQGRLQQRKRSQSPQRPSGEESSPWLKKTSRVEKEKTDFLDGLDIGEGEVFNSKTLTLHRNVQVKGPTSTVAARPKTSISLTFSNKSTSSTRIPRLNHERQHSTALEPVSESGEPISRTTRRSQSRLGGHSANTSLSSVISPPTPTASSSIRSHTPATPRRRDIASKPSMASLRNEPTTTSSQLLKQKRSLPAIKSPNASAKPFSFRSERPPSRSEGVRPPSGLRPKTPVDRPRPGSSDSVGSQARRTALPPLPPMPLSGHPHHSSAKTLRHFRRHDSDNAIDMRPRSRAFSRSTMRSPSPHRYKVAADTWERLSKPKSRKQFGDGHELDGFDDLPTSRETENRFMKQPMTSGPKTLLRKQTLQNILPDRTTSPAPSLIQSPSRSAHTPRFARDTAASRIARETSLAHRIPPSTPLVPLTSQRIAQLSTRNNSTPQPYALHSTVRSKKPLKRTPQLKPHLISNLNGGKETKG